jgi:hypothetical protein
VARALEFWEAHLAVLYRGKRDRLHALEKAFFHEAQGHGRAYLQEIRAMAEGADVPFKALFRLNLTELSSYVEKCTDLILPVETARGRSILLAHNEDWDPRRNDVFLLQARLPHVEYATLAYNGYLPGLSAGLNSYGLIHSVNYLAPKDFRVGLPRIFLTRYLLTARGIDDFLQHLRNVPRAFGQAIHLAEGRRYLGLELSARHGVRLSPRLPAVHSNHYLSPKLRARVPAPSPNSQRRLTVARRLLREALPLLKRKHFSKSVVKETARRILSDRSGAPYAIWRRAEIPQEISVTVATVLVDTAGLRMEVYRGKPSGKLAAALRLSPK